LNLHEGIKDYLAEIFLLISETFFAFIFLLVWIIYPIKRSVFYLLPTRRIGGNSLVYPWLGITQLLAGMVLRPARR